MGQTLEAEASLQHRFLDRRITMAEVFQLRRYIQP
jgi:hypothetical protein